MSIGDFPEGLSRAMLVGTMLVGGLAVFQFQRRNIKTTRSQPYYLPVCELSLRSLTKEITNMSRALLLSYLYHIILYYIILYHTANLRGLYYTTLHHTIPYHTILYYTILYYAIMYYTILYYTML